MLGNVFQLQLLEGVWSKTTEENRVAVLSVQGEGSVSHVNTHTT